MRRGLSRGLTLRVWGWVVGRVAGEGAPSPQQGRGVGAGVGPTERCHASRDRRGPLGRAPLWESPL